MTILNWLQSTVRGLTRGGRRRTAMQRRLSATDALEPRLLLTATKVNDIPGVRLSGANDAAVLDLSQFFDDPAITGTTVQIATALGSFYVETYDSITPITAKNFTDLIAAGNYQDMFFHRSLPGFVLQGGGFTFAEDASGTASVAHNGTIVNEFDNWFDPEFGGLTAGTPINTRGTIAMAKVAGDADSATSQYFVSVDDNQSTLDPQNGGFTVFAHVLFNGMDMVDQLVALQVVNAGGVFETLPVIDLDPNATSIERENLVLSTTTIVDELGFSMTANSNPDLVIAEVVDGQLSITSTSLAATQSGTVQVTVVARDLQGNQVSSVVNVAIGVPVATDITGPTQVTTSLPTITWNAVESADTYDLWVTKLDDRFTSVNDVPGIVQQNGITETSFTATEELPDGQYKAWVRSRNSEGTSIWSPAFLFYVGLTTPERGSVASVEPVAQDELRVTVQWDTASEATHYDIWLSQVGGDTVVQENWLSGNSFTTAGQLLDGRTYQVWVRGRNAAKTGNWSPGYTFTAGSAIPDAVTITGPTSGSAVVEGRRPTIEWTASPVADVYDVWVTKVGTSGAFLRTTTELPRLDPTEDFSDGFYRVWVRARNGNGMSVWSSSITIGIGGPAAELTGPTGDSIPNRPNITWTAGIPGSTYQLWVNQVNGTSKVIFESQLTTTTFTPSTDLAAGSYQAWIRQVPASGPALPWSPSFRFQVGAGTVPPQPTLTVSSTTGTPTFAWQSVANAVRYELWVNRDGASRVLHETDLTTLSYVATELQTAGSHRAWLRAFNAANIAGEWSTVLIFDV